MKKIELARIIEQISWQARKDHFNIVVVYPRIWEKYGKGEGTKHFVESASNAAGTKLIKGKITFNGTYIVSRGKELPFYKPNAVAEYSSHWPYDYCYFYRL